MNQPGLFIETCGRLTRVTRVGEPSTIDGSYSTVVEQWDSRHNYQREIHLSNADGEIVHSAVVETQERHGIPQEPPFDPDCIGCRLVEMDGGIQTWHLCEGCYWESKGWEAT